MIGNINIRGNVIEGVDNYLRSLESGERITNSYRHKIGADYGFTSMKFSVEPCKTLSEQDIFELFEFGLGRDISSYSDNTLLAWEGMIHRMTLSYPGFSIITSLDDVFNRVWIRYLENDGGQIARSTVLNDTKSQEYIGIKEGVVEAAVLSTTVANQETAAYLAAVSKFRPGAMSFKQNDQGIELEIEARGYWHTLDWIHYNQTASAAASNISAVVTAVMATNAAQYINIQQIDSNTTAVPSVYDGDDPSGQIIQELARYSDASYNRWIARVEDGRRFRFKQAAGAPEADESPDYVVDIRDAGLVFKSPNTGEAYRPELIRPDRWLRMLGGFGVVGFKPGVSDISQTYIESVSFKEPDSLTLSGNKANTESSILARINELGSDLS